MKPSTDNLLLFAIASLTIAAVVIVTAGSPAGPPRNAERGFQQTLGGLGLGCQLDLTRSSWQFDPRIADENPVFDTLGGIGQLSPWHATALFPSPDDVHLAEE
jgi:hypothetical protein